MLAFTLRSAMAQADDPGRVFLGVVEQACLTGAGLAVPHHALHTARPGQLGLEVDHVIAVFRQRKTRGFCLRGHNDGKHSGENRQSKGGKARCHGWAMLA